MTVDALFTALADPTRRRIFETVARAGEASVAELAATLPVTRGAVSQHLKTLLDAGLLTVEAQGRRRIHRVRPEGLQALAAYAQQPMAPETVPDPVAAELSKWAAQAPHIDHGALALLMYLAQIGQYVMTSNSEVARRAGLSFSDITVLGALRRLGPPYESTPTQLARTFWITLPGMTKRLSKLEGLGLLKRRADPDDGRSIFMRLTPKGLGLLRELVARNQPPEYYALLQLTPAERARLSGLLRQLLEAIDARHGRRRPPYLVNAADR